MRSWSERFCIDCRRTLVMDPLHGGWTPVPERAGWMCPDCARRLGYLKPLRSAASHLMRATPFVARGAPTGREDRAIVLVVESFEALRGR